MEAGDLVQPLERGLFEEDHIKCELGEALIDENKGRANEYEVTFFKSVGIASQDQFMASLIYDWVVDNNSGIVVSL
jgi:ornithine cyclodeaminase